MAVAEEKVGRFRRMGNFFEEVKLEMRKVTWPTRGELYGATLVVVAVTVILCVVLGAFDLGFGRLIELLMARR